jgi:CHAT domain-containing protein
MRARWWTVLLAWAHTTCQPQREPVLWQLGGCADVLADGACELPPDGHLVVWTSAPTEVRLEDGEAAAAEAIDGGSRLRLTARAGALQIVGGVPPRVTLLPARAADEVDALAERGRSGAPDAVLAELEAAGASPDPRLSELKAKLLLRAGRVEEALGAWEEAIAGQIAAGRVGSQIRATVALVFLQRTRGAAPLPEVRRRLEALEPLLALDADGRARARYHLALVERDAGQIRRALQRLDETEILARHVANDKLGRDVLNVRGALLADLGRAEDARLMLEQAIDLLPSQPAACEEAELRTNAGWIAWLAWEAGRGRLDRPSWERAAELFRAACPRLDQVANAEINLALLALGEGRPEEARRALTRARAATDHPSASQRAWSDLVEARLLDADAGAVPRWRALLDRAEGAGLTDVAWRAACGLAEAQHRAGQHEAAIPTWREAEALLDRLASLAPVGEGRDLLVGDRDRSARGLVDALLRAGRPEEALDAGRHARVRALWSMASAWRVSEQVQPQDTGLASRYRQLREDTAIEAADDWSLPTPDAEARRVARAGRLSRARQELLDSLGWRAPEPVPLAALPDTTLVWLPVREGMAAFSVVAGQVRALRLPTPDPASPPEVLAAALLEPFDAELAAARRVRLLAAGDVRRIDLHALPWRGAPLGEQRAVVWTLDLAPPAPVDRSGVLVAGDPEDDLGAARAEARAVAARHGVEPLLGAQITRGAIDSALRRVRLAHFSGHGAAAGWQSALQLAGGDAYDVTDVLTLSQVPEQVVLTACSTAADQGTTWDGAGLAHAFVLAGARQVVAAVRPVADTSAAALGESLHDPAYATLGDAAEALRRARVELRQTVPTTDLTAWRVIEP